MRHPEGNESTFVLLNANEFPNEPRQSIGVANVKCAVNLARKQDQGRQSRVWILLALSGFVVVLGLGYLLYWTLSQSSGMSSASGDSKTISSLSFPGCGTRNLSCSGDCSHGRFRRIVGGTTVSSDRAWPWMVDILIDGRHVCGGTLVSDHIVLTAAHCFFISDELVEESRVEVRVGTLSRLVHESATQASTMQASPACRVYIHDEFNIQSLHNDIAIVKASKAFALSQRVWPACLPAKDTNLKMNGGTGYILGWGRNAPHGSLATVLQQAMMPIIPATSCSINNGIFGHVTVDTETNLCAGYGKHSPEHGCLGDSGGPLLQTWKEHHASPGRWLLTGVMSWGDPACSSQDGAYSVFTKVANYEKWIGKYF